MKWGLIYVQSNREDWSDESDSLYLKKINPFVSFELVSVKSPKLDRDDRSAKIAKESQMLISKLTPGDFVVLFDEKGKNMNSLDWAREVQKINEGGSRRAWLIIGGAFGVSDEIKNRAQATWSLGPFVMNHLVARTVVLEQFYRSQTILKNIPYHNA